MAKGKTVIKNEVEVNASKEKVWDVIANFGDIYKASPGVAKFFITSEQKTGVGTTRHCDLTMMGASLEEKVIGWEEGKSIKIDIYERKNLPLINGMIAEFMMREENGKTILSGTMEYDMTGGLGDVMNNLVMKKMNTKNWASLLAGFKKHAETGEEVTQKTKLDLNKVITVN